MHCSVDYSKMRSIQHLKIKEVANFIKNKGIAVTTYIPSEESGLSKLVFKASTELASSFCERESFTFFYGTPQYFLKILRDQVRQDTYLMFVWENTLENQQ